MMLELAARAADQVVEQLRPLCRRLEVVGSVRRRSPEVRDLEILCIPDVLRYIEFQKLVHTWPEIKGRPSGKYTRRRLVRFGLELDLFMCSELTWACNLVIRTGCADYSRALMVYAQDRGYRFRDAQLYHEARRVAVLEEEDVFRALGLAWRRPEDRTQTAAQQLLSLVHR